MKWLAAWCARAYRKQEQFAKLKAKLVELMRGLNTSRLGYWAEVVMIDGRWCGETGQGAYWAVASECVNKAGEQVLKERGLKAEWRIGVALVLLVCFRLRGVEDVANHQTRHIPRIVAAQTYRYGSGVEKVALPFRWPGHNGGFHATYCGEDAERKRRFCASRRQHIRIR